MGRITITNRILQEKKDSLTSAGFVIELIPTSDNEKTGDKWIILSKDEIDITHRIGRDVYGDDRTLYHCLNVMEKEHQKWSACMVSELPTT